MGGPLLIAALAAPAWAEGCGSLLDEVDEAQRALLLMDVGAARDALARAEATLACGWAEDRELLGRFWLVEGALLTFEGDADAAADSFRAAHRVAPTLWLVDLGPALLQAYEAAAAAGPGSGRIEAKDLDPAYLVRIDGLPLQGDSVDAGLHVVQVGFREVLFGQVVYVLENQTSLLELDLPRLTPEPTATTGDEVPSATARRRYRPSTVHAALGLAGSTGEALARRTADGDRAEEPGAKLRVPVEVGVVPRWRGAWGRATLGGGPLLGGRLLYQGDDGVRATAWPLTCALAAGGAIGPVDVGAQLGVLLPSRWTAGGVASVELGGAWAAEARLGVDLHAARGLEPAGALLAVWRPEAPW